MVFDYTSVLKLLDEPSDAKWQDYLKCRKDVYYPLVQENLKNNLVSEANWVLRSQFPSSEEMGIIVHTGDICYMDYGQAYVNEMGYQHFGLIMSICRKKALVIPMTSNTAQYDSAYEPNHNPEGKIHLMKLGCIPGMKKPSVLFLNDVKYVNTARMIDVKAHIDVEGPLFQKIQKRMMEVMFSKDMLR